MTLSFLLRLGSVYTLLSNM